MTYIHTYYMYTHIVCVHTWFTSAPIAPGGQTSSAFYTHGTRTSTMLDKKERKNASHCLSAFRNAGSSRFFLKFFCTSIIHPKKNLIKM